MRLCHKLLFRCLVVLITWNVSQDFFGNSALAQSPLATTIDSLIEPDIDQLISPREQDGLLLRRLSLDLRLVVPTQNELDEFLADSPNDRWAKWVKRFLDDPLHRERMVDWLDKTLMQRRAYTNVDRNKWLAYLRQVVDERKPLDQVLREVVGSTWWNSSQRAQQRFFVDRGGDSHLVTRDIGRVFFGRDMQCAQCHDHPQVTDYLQIDYHGILAFVSSSSLAEAKYKDEKGAEQKLQIYAEKAAGDAPFESVFDKGVLFRSGTRVIGGLEQFDPYQAPDQRYQDSNAPESLEGAPKPPTASRRQSLVAQLSVANKAFTENWANRLWALMLGRGIVHPLDMHHADNPPTNPKLLHALSESLVASGYDVRTIIEQIALSQAYQRAGTLPIESTLRFGTAINLPPETLQALTNNASARKSAIEAQLPALTAAADSAKNAMNDAESAWRKTQKDRVVVRGELDKAEGVFNEAKKKADETKVALATVTQQRDNLNSRIALLTEAATKIEQAKALIGAEDAELAQAIATTKAKTEAAKSELPTRDKAVADATAARDANVALLEAERTKTIEVVSRLRPVEEALRVADAAYLLARSKWQSAESEFILANEKVAQLTRVQEWVARSAAVAQSESEQVLSIAARDQIKATIANNVTQIAAAQQKAGIANTAMIAIQGELTGVQTKQTTIQSEIAQLQQALDSLDKSSGLVDSADALNSAKQSLIASQQTRQTSITTLQTESGAIEKELVEQTKALEAANNEYAALEAAQSIANSSLQIAEQTVAAKQTSTQQAIETCSTAMQRVIQDRQKMGYAAVFRALSPEQLGWSVLRATNVYNNYVNGELAELEKQAPLAADASAEQKLQRQVQANRQAMDKLRGNIDAFANLYASGIGQTSDEFFASPDQALYMANGGAVFAWSAPSGNNVTTAVVQNPDPIAAATVIYRALLSRDPSPQEQQWLSQQLAAAQDKKPAIAQELVWGLLTSSEFRVYP